MAKKGDGWLSREMGGYKQGDVCLSREMGGLAERWVAKQGDGWLAGRWVA